MATATPQPPAVDTDQRVSSVQPPKNLTAVSALVRYRGYHVHLIRDVLELYLRGVHLGTADPASRWPRDAGTAIREAKQVLADRKALNGGRS